MARTLAQEPESPTAAVAEKAPAPAAAVSAPAVDLSAVPETPTELLRQWDGAARPDPRRGLRAVIARCWDGLTGPGMTEQARVQRDLAEAKGFAYGYTRLS